MQIFRCPACGAPLYFRNTACACGQEVVFDPEQQVMRALERPCANRDLIACNWRTESEGALCRACAMTETHPDLEAPGNLALWTDTERAKRWMLANLARWGWFTASDPGPAPMFRMLAEETSEGDAQVTMGHADGVITINVTEASGAVLAERQENLGELYRTMLGHLRHETAHFLQLRLTAEPGFAEAFRALFGDEREDYAEALARHYEEPQSPGETHVTAYATAHPHEDWAETIAHLLHLVDLVDSAAAAGLKLPEGPAPGHDAYAATDTAAEISLAVALALAMNHVNRALDLPDLYPFVITEPVREKLAFAHARLRAGPPAP